MPDVAQLGAILDRVQTLTRNADGKATAMGFAQLGLPTLLGASLKEWFLEPSLNSYKPFIAIATVVWAWSLVCTVFVFFARTKNEGRKSLTYAGDIAMLTLDEFDEKISALGAEDLEADLRSQIWVCAAICRVKYVWLDRAIKALGCSWGIVVTCYFIRGLVN